MQPLDVYVLGAGASYVHGAPLTDEIVPFALNRTPEAQDPRFEPLRRYLLEAFHFDSGIQMVEERSSSDPHWSKCPGLVDLLSIVDMALDRKESLVRGFDHDRLREVRRAIERAIFKALECSLSAGNPTGRRSIATKRLVQTLAPEQSAIISFNYDVIVDIALAHRANSAFDFSRADYETLSDVDRLGIDYGVDFTNLAPDPAPSDRFRLLKLHGSFNWVVSTLTGNLYFGGLEKAVGAVLDYQSLPDDQQQAAGRVANLFGFFEQRDSGAGAEEVAALEPVLITPTHLKDLRNHNLAVIWRAAEEVLRRARRVTFIGYSLPGDDLHVKYLLKHSIETRYLSDPPEIVVVDYHDPEREPHGSQVELNYRRFFGEIDFHPGGFDEYADALPV